MDTTETLVTFAQAPKYVPGHRPNLSQIYRWTMRGLRGIKLEWLQIGGKRFTSIEAIDRFVRALTAVTKGEAPPTGSTSARRRRDREDARELGAAGFRVAGG